IVLDKAANDFKTVVVGADKDVTLVDANDIDLGASTVSGKLNVTATAGGITQSGTVSVKNDTTTLAADATKNIVLADAGNDFKTVVVTSGKDVTLVDANDID